MKKGLMFVVLFSWFCLITPVNAEEINVLYQNEVTYLYDNNSISIVDPGELNATYDLNYMYQYLMDKYNSDYENDYPYYIVTFTNRLNENNTFRGNNMVFYLFNEIPTPTIRTDLGISEVIYYDNVDVTLILDESPINSYSYSEGGNTILINPIPISHAINGNYYYNPTYLYDSNFNITNITSNTFNIQSQNLVIEPNDDFTSYKNRENENYTEVNLDNYEYVLLSLKNYSQTQAFQTNFQIKGQIGITPIYNFGQTSKDSITGVKVQDRCNVNYQNYTNYPFYILQTDLQNNAIFAVKECSQGSSFKFDNTVFNITYITQENEENPTITINGTTYNVIPYGDLPSTATKNEEENYIPGESGNATDLGGLDSTVKNVQQKMSEIWNTFTYFTDFVGQLFSSLPEEVQTILLSAFTIGIVLGLIKIFIN